MSDPVVTLTPDQVSVPVNGQVGVVVTVRNVSSIVEGYRLELLAQEPSGGPAAWGEVQPPEVRVYPNEQATAMVTFAPPAGAAAPSGRFAFGVRVRSVVDPDASSVVEGDVEIGQVLGLQAKLVPVTSTGRWRGRHVVRFTNWGNTSTRLHVTVTDPDDRLGFLPAESEVDLPLGASADLKVKVRPRKPFLRGTPVRLPFQIVGEPVGPPAPAGVPRPVLPGDPSRPVVDGAMTQKPILTKLTVAVVVLALAGAAGLGAYVWKKPHPLRTFETEGPPATPENPVATALPDGGIQFTWSAVDQVEKYKVVVTQGGKGILVTDVPAEQQAFTAPGLSPKTLYCFTVSSVRGQLPPSPASKPACKSTVAPVAPSGSPTASTSGGTSSSPAGPSSAVSGASGGAAGPVVVAPSGSGAASGTTAPGPSPVPTPNASQVEQRPRGLSYPNGAYAVEVWISPGAETDATAHATAQQQQALLLQKGGSTFYLIHTSWYPQLTFAGSPVKPAWMVVSPPLATFDAAFHWCDALGIARKCYTIVPGD